MGPFPMSEQCEYILVAVDYVSKWVEALPCVAADSRSSKRIFQETIFPRFGVPRVVISDGGSHFIDKTFKKCLSELGVDHWVATPYHPQTSGQAETSNKQIKNCRIAIPASPPGVYPVIEFQDGDLRTKSSMVTRRRRDLNKFKPR